MSSENPGFQLNCPVPAQVSDHILLGHGSGGKLSHKLIQELFLPEFSNAILDRLDDQARLEIGGARLAFTTDAFVVTPHEFPGGDIGKLAVCGTVNDLAMCGARPLYISASFILEEGFPTYDLQRYVASMQATCAGLGVELVAGDTKVVERGKCDGLFITTSGIGLIEHDRDISSSAAKPGDKIIASGTIGDHGIAVMASREGIEFETELQSDCAPLWPLVQRALGTGAEIHTMRDPTRGGVASALKEIATSSGVGIELWERSLPIRDEVRAACEMLGFDPLYVANEGMCLMIVAPGDAERLLDTLCSHPLGANAAIIGEVTEGPAGSVHLKAIAGGTRIVELLPGEQLPRIC